MEAGAGLYTILERKEEDEGQVMYNDVEMWSMPWVFWKQTRKHNKIHTL